MVKQFVMCSHCGCVSDYHPPDHKFCGNCGNEFPENLKSIAYTCPKCKRTDKGGNVFGTAEYCEYCGTKL